MTIVGGGVGMVLRLILPRLPPYLQHAEKLLHVRPLRLQQLVHHVAEKPDARHQPQQRPPGGGSFNVSKVLTAEALPGFPPPLRGTRAWCRHCAGETRAERAKHNINFRGQCCRFHRPKNPERKCALTFLQMALSAENLLSFLC